MQNNKRFLNIIFAFVIFIILSGACSTKSYAATEYDVWVNGDRFSSDKTEIPCGSGTATYDAGTKTLTLKNATITEFGKIIVDETTRIPCYIGANDDLTIKLVGENKAELSDSSKYGDGAGIVLNGDYKLVVTGSGSLSMDWVSRGIRTGDSNTRSGELKIDSTNIKIKTVYYYGEGIDVNGVVSINNSTIDINSNYMGIHQNSQQTMEINNSTVNIESRDDGIFIGDTYHSRYEEVGMKMTDSSITINSTAGYGIGFNRYNGGSECLGSITMDGGLLEMHTDKGGTDQTDDSFIKLNGAVYKEGFTMLAQDVKLEASRVIIDLDGHGDNITFITDRSSTLTKEQLMERVENVPAEVDGYVFMGLAPKAMSSYKDFDAYEKDISSDKENGWSVSTAKDVTVYGIWFKKIAGININIVPPMDGEKAGTPVVTTSTKGCNISGKWTKTSKVTDTSAFTGSFEANKTYHLNISLENQWGYAFPKDGKVTFKIVEGTVKDKSVSQVDAKSVLKIAVDVVATERGKDSGRTTENTTEKNTDKDNQKGEDGTNLGKGASEKLAEKTILSTKSESDPKGSVYNVLQLRARKVTKNKITLVCANAKKQGAVKYVLYGNKCGKKNKYVKIATSKKTTFKVSKIAKKKLVKGTYYKFIVIAVDKNGKVVSTSKTVHVSTTGGKVGNYKKVTTAAKKNKVTVKVKKKFKLKAKAVAASKKLKVKKHRAIKYESTNTKIATVNTKGIVTGKKKGTCYVYAYSQSGVAAKIKVTVK